MHNESTHRLETRFVWVPTGYVQCDGATARFDEVVNTTKRVKRKVFPPTPQGWIGYQPISALLAIELNSGPEKIS